MRWTATAGTSANSGAGVLSLTLAPHPTPSPTPVLSFDTWLDPVFPWRTGVIIFSAILAMSIVVLIARHRERRRR